MAAAICTEQKILPRQILDGERIHCLQQRLLRFGQYIPGIVARDCNDAARGAQITASSSLQIDTLEASGEVQKADMPCALLLPIPAGKIPSISLLVDTESPARLEVEVWRSSRPGNATPDEKLISSSVTVDGGERVPVQFHFDAKVDADAHVFFIVRPVPGVSLHLSKQQLPGVLTLWQKFNRSVAKSATQIPPEGSGVDRFEFWLPERRPTARNLAVTVCPSLRCYEPSMVVNGWSRPWCGANAWAPAASDPQPSLQLKWDHPRNLQAIEVKFDTDFDHPMETVLMGHPERVMPGCVTGFEVKTAEGATLARVEEHHQTHWRLNLSDPVRTTGIELAILSHGSAPPAVYEVRCY
jgi:hypothetical protein